MHVTTSLSVDSSESVPLFRLSRNLYRTSVLWALAGSLDVPVFCKMCVVLVAAYLCMTGCHQLLLVVLWIAFF